MPNKIVFSLNGQLFFFRTKTGEYSRTPTGFSGGMRSYFKNLLIIYKIGMELRGAVDDEYFTATSL